MRISAAAALAAVLITTGSGPVQATSPAWAKFEKAKQAARALKAGGSDSFAGYTLAVSLIGDWEVVTLYDIPTKGGRWVARRETGRYDRSFGVAWADSDTCPDFRAALQDLEALPAPVAVLGLNPAPVTEVMIDGPGFGLWVDSYWPGHPNSYGKVEMSGGPETPLGGWVSETDERLAHCWGRAEPPNLGR